MIGPQTAAKLRDRWPGSEADLEHMLAEAGLAPEAADHVSLMDHLREVDPGPWLDWWHVGAMIEHAQAVLDGEIRRLVICAPPRTYKSRPIVQGVPACRLRNEPSAKIMVACAVDELMLFHSRYAKDQALDAGVQLRPDSTSASLWQTSSGGAFKVMTVRGGRLGFGWDTGVIDDPFASYELAQRVTEQKRTWKWWRNDWSTRAQSRPEGGPPGEILINQRLAKGDLWGRIVAWLEETGTEQEWHALMLKGYQERASVVLPGCVKIADDPRKPGEALCPDDETMRQIDERRQTNVLLHRAVDQQDPAENASGGLFCGPWFRRLGPPAPGEERPDPSRLYRGWDLSAGGSDAMASTKGGPLPGDRWRWVDMTEDWPAPASVQSLIIETAERDGREVEIVIPSEVAIGKLFSDQLVDLLRRMGFTVHLAPQRGPKRSRALHHAAAAAAICTTCRKLIVPEFSENLFREQGVCQCPEPGGDGFGRVELDMPAAKAERFAAQHHAFTGKDGGEDDIVDAAAITYNGHPRISRGVSKARLRSL